jgi:hypothetical protein
MLSGHALHRAAEPVKVNSGRGHGTQLLPWLLLLLLVSSSPAPQGFTSTLNCKLGIDKRCVPARVMRIGTRVPGGACSLRKGKLATPLGTSATDTPERSTQAKELLLPPALLLSLLLLRAGWSSCRTAAGV